MKKPHLSIRTTLLVSIGILNIMIAVLVGNGVRESWTHYDMAQSLKKGSNIVDAFYTVNRNLSLERAASLSAMYAPPDTAKFLQEDISKSRQDADAALAAAFSPRLEASGSVQSAAEITTKYRALQALRQALDDAMKKPAEGRDLAISDNIFQASTALIVEIQNFILIYTRSYKGLDAATSRQMMFKYFVWELAEDAGKEYAIIGKMIARDKRPTADQQEELMLLRGRIQYGWDILHIYSLRDQLAEKLLPYVEEAQTHYFMTFDQIKDLFYGFSSGATNESYPISIEMWLGMASQAVDSLLALQDQVIKESQRQVEQMEREVWNEILISILVFWCALALSFYCWSIIVLRVARPVKAMVNALYKATHDEIYEMPKIHYHHDEIGKLASVLEVFQDNARKMKQSNEELERFAYIAAHDLKSPLRAVENISQWLEEDLAGVLPEKDQKYMEELRGRVRLMDKMLDDTLEYARVGAKMEGTTQEIINGKALIEDIVTLLSPPKGFTIKIGDNLSQINLQKLPVQQVLYNLVNNALKHHDKVSGVIEVNVQENKNEFIFSVRDDGPGIAPQYHQKIFDMFQTLRPRDKSKGRGMGLAIVRKIVTTNGGVITVDSDLGKGTSFRFTWPKSETKTTGEEDAHARRRYA